MNKTQSTIAETAAEIRHLGYMELSPFDRRFNEASDRIVAWMEKWIIKPLLGKEGAANDY